MPAAITAIHAGRVPLSLINGVEAVLGLLAEAMVEVRSGIYIFRTVWDEVYRGCVAISLLLELPGLPMTNK